MGELQERITSTKKGSITSVQAIYVPADDYTDPAHIEDMAAQSAETWFNEVRAKGSKKAPTVSQRKEIGKILDDIRKNFKKRRQSSNNKILYNGIK